MKLFSSYFPDTISFKHDILYLQSQGNKQLETWLISQNQCYCEINVHILVLNHFNSLHVDNSEMMKKVIVKNIKADYFSPVFTIC